MTFFDNHSQATDVSLPASMFQTQKVGLLNLLFTGRCTVYDSFNVKYSGMYMQCPVANKLGPQAYHN